MRVSQSAEGPGLRPNRLALVSAALRHVRDAENLFCESPSRSVDQAWHLAGFGPECIRKACLTEPWADMALGHALGESVEVSLDFALSLDPRAWRLGLANWRGTGLLNRWNPQDRYVATGTAVESDVSELLLLSRSKVDSVVATMWASGLLEAVPK